MIDKLMPLLEDNKFLVAGLGVSGFGLLSFWLKDIPLKIFGMVKRQVTTDLTVQNYDIVFYDLLELFRGQLTKRNFRTLKVNNGKWGSNDKILTSMGYGDHFIFYKKHLLMFSYNKEADSVSDKIKETIIITKLGRSKKFFEEIITDIEVMKQKDANKLELHTYDSGWMFSKKFRKRNINSIFIEKIKKNTILNNLKKFISSEDWYINTGIPYQYGIMLYGSPGTGKTSLIKAIATVLNYDIYYLTTTKLGSVASALTECPEKSIIVIEDIDTSSSVHERSKKKNQKTEGNVLESFLQVNLSDILNALDGLGNTHGRLLIATTNHIADLDEALIRPGRFDLLVEVGFVNKEILKEFMDYYFKNNKIKYNFPIKNKTTVAQLQNMILLGNDQDQIINNIRKRQRKIK
ncbi:MAG: AAA family ATPase [Promethearchaeota archaeon]